MKLANGSIEPTLHVLIFTPNISNPPKSYAQSVGRFSPPQAKFCFACGTKILTQRETVIEQLSATRSSSTLLPERARDAFLAAVNGAIRYLEGLPDV